MPASRLAHILLAAAALASGAPLLAQVEGDIIVTGERPEDEVDGSEVRRQSRAITPRGGVTGEPLARFTDPICPGVWGLSGQSAQYMIDRIYFNAEAAGLELNESAGCAANVIVAFVEEPHVEFAALVSARHHLVQSMTFWERKHVRETTGPVLAWNVVATLTSSGESRQGDPPTIESTQTTRLTSGSRRDMQLSVVMIDSDLLEDLDGLALADYATMRSLARTLPVEQGEASYGTILSLFSDPVHAPQSLTPFDRAYLASLYAGRGNQPGHMALRDVEDRMAGVVAE